MANPHKGEVEVRAGAEVYTLRYTVNAKVQIEAAFDLPWGKVIERIFDPDVRTTDMVRFFAGGLWHHHRDITDAEAGEIMDAAGEAETVRAILKALGLSVPEDEGGAKKKPARPRKASG